MAWGKLRVQLVKFILNLTLSTAEAKFSMTRSRYYFAARTREPRFHLARIFTGLGTVSKDLRSSLSYRSKGTISKSLLGGWAENKMRI